MKLLRWVDFKPHLIVTMIVALLFMLIPFAIPQPVHAATTADVTVNATPSYIAISCNVSEYDFGTVATSSTTNSSTGYFGITNTSTVQTDQTISVTSNWTGGVGWTHAEDASPGADTAGMMAARSGQSWVTVTSGNPPYVYENCAALTDYTFGLSLLAPTSYSDGVEKSITVRVSAAAG